MLSSLQTWSCTTFENCGITVMCLSIRTESKHRYSVAIKLRLIQLQYFYNSLLYSFIYLLWTFFEENRRTSIFAARGNPAIRFMVIFIGMSDCGGMAPIPFTEESKFEIHFLLDSSQERVLLCSRKILIYVETQARVSSAQSYLQFGTKEGVGCSMSTKRLYVYTCGNLVHFSHTTEL
jgi:hypothetical protein